MQEIEREHEVSTNKLQAKHKLQSETLRSQIEV